MYTEERGTWRPRIYQCYPVRIKDDKDDMAALEKYVTWYKNACVRRFGEYALNVIDGAYVK